MRFSLLGYAGLGHVASRCVRMGVLPVVSGLMMFGMAMMAGAGQAHALLLTDSYVFVGPRSGAAVFKMKNTTQRPEAYRIEWTELLMNEGGGKEAAEAEGLTAAGVLSASPHMYVAPRRLMIQPGQVQNIRFMVRRNNNLAPGEYRSYVAISPEQIPDAFTGEAAQSTASTGTRSLAITMLTGYRIPVFFLHGDTTLNVAFSDVTARNTGSGTYQVNYRIERSGTRSALGLVEFFCTGTDGKKNTLFRADTRIFKELDSREFTHNVSVPATGCTDYRMGFKVHAQDPSASPGFMAEATLDIR